MTTINWLHVCLSLYMSLWQNGLFYQHLLFTSYFFFSTCSLQQLEDRQQATARYENRKRDVNYWLDNMESRLDQLDLAPEESETVEIQIQQLRVSHK